MSVARNSPRGWPQQKSFHLYLSIFLSCMLQRQSPLFPFLPYCSSLCSHFTVLLHSLPLLYLRTQCHFTVHLYTFFDFYFTSNMGTRMTKWERAMHGRKVVGSLRHIMKERKVKKIDSNGIIVITITYANETGVEWKSEIKEPSS